MCSFFTLEFSLQLDVGSSLESAEVVGEEGALVGGEGVTTEAAAARGTNSGAVGRSATLVGETHVVAGALRTGAGDREVEVGALQGPNFLAGAIVRLG